MDTLAFGCILPATGRIRDFHPLERALAGRTATKSDHIYFDRLFVCCSCAVLVWSVQDVRFRSDISGL